MKKILTFFCFVFLVTPLVLFAHAADTSALSGPAMMRALEDRALGEPLHEEMETLMQKMLSGDTLTDTEEDQLVTFMNDYPGPYGMMMNRMTGDASSVSRWGGMMGMMGGMGWGGQFPFAMWFFWALAVVWLIVGILLIVWLGRRINQ